MRCSAVFAVAACVVMQFLGGGHVYGYAALRPLLVSEGAFAYTCGSDPTPCKAQQSRLNVAYTVTMSLLCFSSLIFGYYLDFHGPSRCMTVGTLLNMTGTGLLMVASRFPTSDALWFLGLIFWGISAPAVMNPILTLPKTVSLLSPKDSGGRYTAWITPLVLAAFDASSGTFALFQLTYIEGNVSWLAVCGGYMVLVGLFGGGCALVLPGQSGTATVDESSTFEGSEHIDAASLVNHSKSSSNLGRQPSILDLPWTFHLKSPAYIGVDLIMGVLVLRNVMYVGSFLNQMKIVAPNDSSTPELVFNIVFPAGGFVGGIFSAGLLAWTKGRDDLLFWCVWVLSVTHGVLNCVEDLACQYAAMALFPLARTFIWTAACDFLARWFPLAVFGRLLGVLNIVVGAFCLIAIPLYDVGLHWNGGNGSFVVVNVAVTIAQALCGFVPFYLTILHRRKLAKQQVLTRIPSTSGLELNVTPMSFAEFMTPAPTAS